MLGYVTLVNDINRALALKGELACVRSEIWLHGTTEEASKLLQPYPAERMKIVREGVGILTDALV